MIVTANINDCAWCLKPANSRCSRCKAVWYCSREHQRMHWSNHKANCYESPVEGVTPEAFASGVKGPDMKSMLEAQRLSMQKGKLRITYVNPRSDRTLERHANDTKPVNRLTSEIKQFARKYLDLKKRRGDNPMMGLGSRDYLMPYGKCYRNVMSLVESEGGSIIIGWQLYEGKYVIEAEGHCLWVPPGYNSKKRAINVTRTLQGTVFSGLFVVSDAAFRHGVGFSPNVIFWK